MEEDQSPGICGKERDWEVSREVHSRGGSGQEQWGVESEEWENRGTFQIYLQSLLNNTESIKSDYLFLNVIVFILIFLG